VLLCIVIRLGPAEFRFLGDVRSEVGLGFSSKFSLFQIGSLVSGGPVPDPISNSLEVRTGPPDTFSKSLEVWTGLQGFTNLFLTMLLACSVCVVVEC